MVSTSPAGSNGAQPTGEMVSASQVGSIAASEGVSPSLAEAVGYQESGFNNSMVSSTGATGVMQIMPGTWNYIGQNLAGPPPLSPDLGDRQHPRRLAAAALAAPADRR